MESTLAPIVLFTYKRLDTLQLTVEALSKNYLASESVLYIFSDAARSEKDRASVEEVRTYIHSITGFHSVIIKEALRNKGLANSIIGGVTEILERHERVIVLEDDLITTPNFLDFMNDSLIYFDHDKCYYSISGCSLKLGLEKKNSHFYSHVRSLSWGWATWKDRWEISYFDKEKIKSTLSNSILQKFDETCGHDISKMLLDSINGRNDSWYVRWVFGNFIKGKKSLFPVLSKVKNIGFNNNGTHCKEISVYEHDEDNLLERQFNFKKQLDLSHKDYNFLKYFDFKYRILYRIKLLFKKGGATLIFNEFKTKINVF